MRGPRMLAGACLLALALIVAGGAAPGRGRAAHAQGLPVQPPIAPTLVHPTDWQADSITSRPPEMPAPADAPAPKSVDSMSMLVPDGASTLPPAVATSFIGLYDTQGEEPPDTQVAVGPNDIIEMVNSSFEIYSRSGSPVRGGGLRSFFQVPSTNEMSTDPRVLYDAASGRFFAAYVSYHNAYNGPGTIHVAVSSTNSANSAWSVYPISVSYFTDYPGLGVSDDKVVVSTNAFPLPGPGNTGLGEQTQILDKAAMVAGTAAQHASTALSPTDFTLRPATNLSSGSTLWMVERASTYSMKLFRVTGSVAAGTAQRTLAATLAIGSQAAPNPAGIPGAAQIVDAGDQRLLDAAWRNGIMWVAASTYCAWGPQDVNGPRSCVHLIQVDTTALSEIQDITYGQSGYEFMWPAVSTDALGNVITVFTRSNETTEPEVRVAGRLASDAQGTLGPSVLVKAGEADYNGTRWGDFSSVSIDPNDPDTLWIAGEYSRGNPGNTFNWGTWIASVSYGHSGGGAGTTRPAQVTVTSTTTGVFCFSYSGPTAAVSSFGTFFGQAVLSVNKLNLPAGNYTSWFRAAPTLATITQLNNGDMICVSAATGSNVFA